MKTVTAFPVAHSITLAVATLGVAHVAGRRSMPRSRSRSCFSDRRSYEAGAVRPASPSATLGRRLCLRPAARFRLRERADPTGPAQSEIPLALLLFNVGVEIRRSRSCSASCCLTLGFVCSGIPLAKAG